MNSAVITQEAAGTGIFARRCHYVMLGLQSGHTSNDIRVKEQDCMASTGSSSSPLSSLRFSTTIILRQGYLSAINCDAC